MVRRLRRTKKNQKYDYNRNRKRLNIKDRLNGRVKCPQIRKEYDKNKVPAKNIREMGLAYNVNRAIPIPNVKRQMKLMERELNNAKPPPAASTGGDESDSEETTAVSIATEQTVKKPRKPAPKQYVADQLEQEANEFNGIRYKLPRPQVRQIMMMVDRYGFNYAEMAKDRRNYEQETWRQFRAKVRRFLRIPAQCTPYLERKGWLDCDMTDATDPRWKEYGTDDEA
ncbi:nucleolar protein 16 [Anopheles darlingi]|uniref:nucleolar protein 16 n=1 Tax=Anopheles darlingi TaxID=43151 RepID=UPI0021000F97|nr:nucleolar protein 16 [Anopheles darlingi]